MTSHAKWCQRSALAGGVIWCGLLLGLALDQLPFCLLEVLFLLAPLVIVPLGLRLAGEPFLSSRIVATLQPFAAALAVAAFWQPTGNVAAVLASGWLLVCSLAGLGAFLNILKRGFRLDENGCVQAAFLYVPVGAGWLFVSRLGIAPFGFTEPIVLLTATHFHFAGFAALMFTAFGLRHKGEVTGFVRLVGVGPVIAGPALVAVGFMTSPSVRLAATLLLSVGLTVISGFLLKSLRSVRSRAAWSLLLISCLSVIVGMILAVAYAGGEAFNVVLIDIPGMIPLHGGANGIGFSLLGLLGWNIAKEI